MKDWNQEHIDRLNTREKPGKIKTAAVTTNNLTKHALKILTMKGFHCWRQNNAAVYDEKLKIYRSNSSTPGISDILGFHLRSGRFLACEIKTGKDRLSDEQTAFLDAVKKAGGIALVVRTIADLEAFTKEL